MLEVSQVSKRFGGLAAVQEASLEVREGSITALIGPNGAGKTTLFAIVAGFIAADAGAIRFRGEEVKGLPPPALARRGLVRTFQIVQPFAGLTVRENIAIACQLRHRNRAAALARAGDTAQRLGMGAMVDQPAGALTIAGRKRLELARALATEPRLLLLDEVMAGLNPAEVAELIALIRGIRDGGVTLLMTEHVMQAVTGLADHVYVLNEGRIIANGASAGVLADPRVVEAYLGRGAAKRPAGDRDRHA